MRVPKNLDQWKNKNMRYLSSIIVLLLPFVFAGCFETREEIARQREEQEVRSTLQQNVMQAGQGIDKVQAEIGRLQGRVEEVEHQRKKDMSGFNSAQNSEQKSTEKAIQELSAKVAALQEAQNTLFEEVKKIHEEALAERSRPAPAPTGSKKKGQAAAGNYESALTAYKAQDFATATAGFRSYIEASPKAKRALEARYYMADSLFKQKQYEQAAAEFGTVHDKTPTSFLGRRSALRLAQSFKSMGKTKDAKAFVELLVQESPNSDEAKTAKKMFK
jgi:TolA-binding protein